MVTDGRANGVSQRQATSPSRSPRSHSRLLLTSSSLRCSVSRHAHAHARVKKISRAIMRRSRARFITREYETTTTRRRRRRRRRRREADEYKFRTAGEAASRFPSLKIPSPRDIIEHPGHKEKPVPRPGSTLPPLVIKTRCFLATRRLIAIAVNGWLSISSSGR